ncbi:MAG: DUF4190 domain-containing protein [Acidimicrobiales bacterium]
MHLRMAPAACALAALASVLFVSVARPVAADGGPVVTSASAQDDGNGQFSVSFSWSSPGDPVVQYIVSNDDGMCTQAQNFSSESGSVQDQPCEDPFNYGETLYVYLSTASNNCNSSQDPSGGGNGYPLTLPSAPTTTTTTTTTEPYSPPTTQESTPSTTTSTEPLAAPGTPSTSTPSQDNCLNHDPFIVDFKSLGTELSQARANLVALENQLGTVRANATLRSIERERQVNQLEKFAIPEQKKKIASLEDGLKRMTSTVEQIKADCAGQSAQDQGSGLPQQANLDNGQVLAQRGARGFEALPWFVDVQSGALYWTEHRLTTFSCRFGSIPDPNKASFTLQRCRYVVTPQAVAVLLGTQFTVNVSKGTTVFRVFSGAVDVTDLAGTKVVKLSAGQTTTVTTGKVPSNAASFTLGAVDRWWAHPAFVATWLLCLLIGLCVVATLVVVYRRRVLAAFASLGPSTVRRWSGERLPWTRTPVASQVEAPLADASLRVRTPKDAIATAEDDAILRSFARHYLAFVVGCFVSLLVGLALMAVASAASHHHPHGSEGALWVAAWILFLIGPVCAVALLARFMQIRSRICSRSVERVLLTHESPERVIALCRQALTVQRFKKISVDTNGMIVARRRTSGQLITPQVQVWVESTEDGSSVHVRCEARAQSVASLMRHPSDNLVSRFATGLVALTDITREWQRAQSEVSPVEDSSLEPHEPSSVDSRREDREVNGFAIAALVLGILWIFWIGSILAAVLGQIGLGQIRRRSQSGRGMAIAGVLLGWAGIAVLVAAIIGTTVASLNAEDRKPAAQILKDAISASENASSVHISGSSDNSSSPVKVDLILSKRVSGGTINEGGQSFGLVISGGYVYLKTGASFWQQTTGDSSVAEALGDQWIKVSETNSEFSGFSRLTHVFSQIKTQGKLYKESDVRLNGIEVIPLTDSAGTTIYVAETGPPYIMRIAHSYLSSQASGNVDLDEYGAAPVSLVPTGAIDISSYLSGSSP